MAITYPALPGQNIIQQVTGPSTNGYTQGVNLVTSPQTRGIPVPTFTLFKGVPAAVNNFAVAQDQTVGASGAMILNSAQIPASAPVGTFVISKPLKYLGQLCVVLDMERVVELNFGGNPTVGVVATMNGYDYRGVQVTQQITLNGALQQSFLNPVAIVQSITFSASLGVGVIVSAGTNNVIGLPYLLSDLSDIVSYWWNEAPGTTIGAGNGWRDAGYTPTTLAIASRTSCRATLILPTPNPNSAISFSFGYYVYGEDSELNGQIANLNQSSLHLGGIQINASATQYVMPTLLSYDALGVQYPGDLAFAQSYVAALAT
jgi:hypothetical protein